MSILSVVILLVKVEIELDMSHYEQLGPKMPKVIERGVDYTANYTIERLQVNSPIDTGYLKGWFRYKDTPSMVDIRSPAQYAIYQDQGTGPIHPKRPGGVLHWEKGGTHYFAKSTKGIKGKRFVEKSIQATTGRLDSLWIKAIRDVLK